jgi:hypothetical protein
MSRKHQQQRCQKRNCKHMSGSQRHKQALNEREYWQVIDEYVAQSQQLRVWHSKWKTAGIKPLTAKQQYSRWVQAQLQHAA